MELKVFQNWFGDNCRCLYFTLTNTPIPCRPTVEVREYNSEKNRLVKNGIRFKIKWR